MSAPSTSTTMTTNSEDRHERPGVGLEVVRVDQRGNRVAQVGRGKDAEEDADRA